MSKKLSLWFDPEADFLELIFEPNKKGFFKDVGGDVFERIGKTGKVTGIAVFNFTKRSLKQQNIKLPVEVKLVAAR